MNNMLLALMIAVLCLPNPAVGQNRIPKIEKESSLILEEPKNTLSNIDLKSVSKAWIWGAIPINGAGLWYSGHKTEGFYMALGSSLALFLGLWTASKDTSSCSDPGSCENIRNIVQVVCFSIYGFTYFVDLLISPYETAKFNEKAVSSHKKGVFLGSDGYILGYRF